MKNKKIAILHSSFSRGGGTDLCLKIIEPLIKKYEMDFIYAGDKIDIEKINKFYGTSFSQNSFRKIHLLKGRKGTVLKSRILQKYFHKHNNLYTLPFSTCNEMDFKKKGIQYIHYPVFKDNYPEKFPLLKRLYRRGCKYISTYSEDRMKENLTLTNSKWTAEKIKEAYSIESTVIYPPVKDDFPEIPWEEKENAFICAGRIDPSKNIERNIEIIKKVREVYPEIKLYIAGIPGKKAYYNKIKKLVGNNSAWVVLKDNLSKEELHNLMTRCRYGIHGMDEEHYGIVVAEMLKAGAIPFVPNGGGQVEIVKENQNLVYNSKEDAVEKIINVLQDNSLQEIVREELKEHSKNFSEKKFKEEILNTVESFIKENE